jgi:hypothetical protein
LGLENLAKVNNKVDYIITHTAPDSVIMELLLHYGPLVDFNHESYDLVKYLDEVKRIATYKRWYFGHMHDDKELSNSFRCLYYDIEQIP